MISVLRYSVTSHYHLNVNGNPPHPISINTTPRIIHRKKLPGNLCQFCINHLLHNEWNINRHPLPKYTTPKLKNPKPLKSALVVRLNAETIRSFQIMTKPLKLYLNDFKIIKAVQDGCNYPAAISIHTGLPRRTLYASLKRLKSQGIIKTGMALSDTRKTIVTLAI